MAATALGNMESMQCRPNDYTRAFFCAEAVGRGQNLEVETFLQSIQDEFPSVRFGDVHVSLGLTGLKFLMADAGDALFIAFQATGEPEDRKSATVPSGGSVDRGIFELSNSFLGPDLNIPCALLHMGKRIVFCGHGVGGAVAHMVVLRFWAAYYQSRDKTRGDENDMISIAFGAPDICSSEYAEEINRNEELKSHFFSFVHEDDPAIPILNGREDHDGGDSLGEAGTLVLYRGGSSADFGRGATDQLRKGADKVKQFVSGLSSNRKNRQQQKFFPIGENTRLKASQGSGPSYESQSPTKQWSFYSSYKSALLEGETRITENSPPDAAQKLALKVITPAPVITSANLKAMDSGSFIHIRGSNLLFLREPVRLGGLDPWETKMQTDTELYIASPPQTDVNIKGDDTEDALAFILLKTAFGAASHLLLEDNMSDGPPTAVRRLLSKIVQILVALAAPPLAQYDSSVLAELDRIVRCVPNLEGEKPSTILKSIAERNDNENLQENIKKMNSVVKQVIEFLTRSFNIRYEEKFPVFLISALESLVLLTGLVLLPPVPGISYVVRVVATTCVFTGGGLAAKAVAILLSKKEIMIPEYLTMLEYAVQEARLWNDDKGNSSLHERTEVALEELLLTEVNRNWSNLNTRMEKIHNSKAEGIKLLSPILKGATSDSKVNLLRRMQIVANTVHMYNTHLMNIVFVGVVGAEDAGKSTFIKKAIQQFGEKPGAEVPDVGFDVHTKRVRPYELNSVENLWLVDFPGTNSTEVYADEWKQFASLPSSCILLLDFKDDVKKDQVRMYKKMEKDLDSKVTVVFNKVDEKFTPRREAAMNEEYFTNQRNRAANKLGCEGKDVHFVCLDPDPVDKLTKLREVGVLGFEELAEIVLRKRIMSLPRE